jgi:hypothetical protein
MLSVGRANAEEGESSDRSIVVRYRYTVDGKDYEGTTIHPAYDYDGDGENIKDGHQQLENLLGSVEKVRVYYRSDDPATSTLSVGFYSGTLAGFFAGSIFFACGSAFLLTGVFALAGNSNFAKGITILK